MDKVMITVSDIKFRDVKAVFKAWLFKKSIYWKTLRNNICIHNVKIEIGNESGTICGICNDGNRKPDEIYLSA